MINEVIIANYHALSIELKLCNGLIQETNLDIHKFTDDQEILKDKLQQLLEIKRSIISEIDDLTDMVDLNTDKLFMPMTALHIHSLPLLAIIHESLQVNFKEHERVIQVTIDPFILEVKKEELQQIGKLLKEVQSIIDQLNQERHV